MTLEELIAEGLGTTETLSKDSNMDNIDGWDSLSHITMVLYLQQIFQIKFSMKEMVDMISVDAITKILHKRNINY